MSITDALLELEVGATVRLELESGTVIAGEVYDVASSLETLYVFRGHREVAIVPTSAIASLEVVA